MFRLLLLTLACLLGILALFGTPELAGHRAVDDRPIVATAPPQATRVSGGRTPVHTAASAAQISPLPAEELLRAAMAPGTTSQQPRFSGPALKPSPESHGTGAGTGTDTGMGASLYVAGDSVNLRHQPSPAAPVITVLDRGTAVAIIGPTTGPWIEVEDAAGNRGFVSARYLTATQAD